MSSSAFPYGQKRTTICMDTRLMDYVKTHCEDNGCTVSGLVSDALCRELSVNISKLPTPEGAKETPKPKKKKAEKKTSSSKKSGKKSSGTKKKKAKKEVPPVEDDGGFDFDFG